MYFRFDYKNARYVATHEDFQDFIAFSNNNRILGTHSWSIINDSKVCGKKISQKMSITSFQLCPNFEHSTKMITFSYCSDTEFTCATGHCVDMNLRCDGRTQCGDGSDEQVQYEYQVTVTSNYRHNVQCSCVPKVNPTQYVMILY